jgi:hypothetical protein
MKKDLPIYDIKLSDDTQGVGFISLVDEPAIGVDWIKLSKQEPVELFMSLTDNGLCFGCPPNGDGTRVNGEPDGRCKGDSAGSGSKGGSKGGGKSPVVSKDISSPEQSISRVTQIGSTMGQAIDDKKIIENAKNAGYLIREDAFASNKTIKITPPGTDSATYKIVYNPGSNSGMPYLSIQDPGRGGESYLERYRNSKPVQDGLKELFKMSKVVKSIMARKSPKSIMAKRVTGTLDGSGCFGCPPNGDGTRVNGEPDGRCKGDGSGKGGSKDVGKSPAKPSSKVSTITPEGHIDTKRASDIIGSSTKYDEKGNSVPVKISKDEMDSIEKSISSIKVNHKPYWGDKDQTSGRGSKYYLGSKDANGNQSIKSVYIQGGKLRTGHEIGWINKDNSTFRLNEFKNSRGFRTSSDAYDLFTNTNTDRPLR